MKGMLLFILFLVAVALLNIKMVNDKNKIAERFKNGETLICTYWFSSYMVENKTWVLKEGYFSNGRTTFQVGECLSNM